MAKVSIGMPAYNSEKTIGIALESLLDQDFGDFELIISDDASQDATPDICGTYEKKDKRIKYFRSETNIGALRNHDKVFDLARGEYFMWACDNDSWEPKYISSCVDVLDNDPSVVLCYSITNLMDENGNAIRAYKDNFRLDQDDKHERYLSMISNIDLCNCFFGLIRAEALKTTNLMHRDWHLVGSCDNILLSELVLKGKFIQLDKPLFNRRRMSTSENIEQRFARIEKMNSPYKSYFGISFPFCRIIQTHVDLIRHSDINLTLQNLLIKETYRIMGSRYSSQLNFELNRASKLISMGIFRHGWGDRIPNLRSNNNKDEVGRSFFCDLLKAFEDVLCIFSDHSKIHYARAILLIEMERIEEARAALVSALKNHPEDHEAKRLFSLL